VHKLLLIINQDSPLDLILEEERGWAAVSDIGNISCLLFRLAESPTERQHQNTGQDSHRVGTDGRPARGNSRVTFTTKPKVDTYTAGYEDANSTVEALNFSPSYASAIRSGTYNRTAGGTKSQRLAGGAVNKTVGLARSFAVVPGDSITVEVYARYANLSNTDSNVGTFIFGALTGAFGLTSTTPGDGGVVYQTLGSLNQAGQLLQDGPAVNENQPKAFLNYLMFDSEFVLYDFGFAQVGSAAANGWLGAPGKN